MYKLFLCLRYLRSRAIAYLAMVGVALCVFMVLVAVSVMNGFLHKIELAAKGLFGDIVLDTRNYEGIPRYDPIIERIEGLPAVEHASPFILTGGLLQIPGQPHIRIPVQITGIRLPQQAQVTDFGKGLFVQGREALPTFNPPVPMMLEAIAREMAKTERIIAREQESPNHTVADLQRYDTALSYQRRGQANLSEAKANELRLDALRNTLKQAKDSGADSSQTDALEHEIQQIQTRSLEPPQNHVILGQAISGLVIRTEQGETVRYMAPGTKIVLGVFPLGRGFSTTSIPFNSRMFSVVDDSRTDVWPIDSSFVYVPFETLQVLNNMDQPNRCSQIHVKVRGEADEARLMEIARDITRVYDEYRREVDNRTAAGGETTADDRALLATDLTVQTWRQKQEAVISPIESQRTLVTIMFGVISLVAVVLIFVIFYMIVLQKTREIGIVKAVGASSAGVASIFLAYGAAVGLVGAVLGSIGAGFFVHYINPIHDWMGRALGFQVWSRKTFMFEKIPNTIDVHDAILIIVGAVLAGLIGAIIPALRAARMQPVEAIRYE